MARVTNSTTRRRKHRALIAQVKGFRLKRKNVFKLAKQALLKAGPYAYVHRRLRKRSNRRLWNIQINAAARQNETTYSDLIASMKQSGVILNRKVLSDIAKVDPQAFTVIAKSSIVPIKAK